MRRVEDNVKKGKKKGVFYSALALNSFNKRDLLGLECALSSMPKNHIPIDFFSFDRSYPSLKM
jgi:hypothetical protein